MNTRLLSLILGTALITLGIIVIFIYLNDLYIIEEGIEEKIVNCYDNFYNQIKGLECIEKENDYNQTIFVAGLVIIITGMIIIITPE